MSTTRHYTIWCDASDCDQWIGQEDTAAEAREIGKLNGWARRRDVDRLIDLCPAHSGRKPEGGNKP